MISFGQLEARTRILYEANSSTRWESSRFLASANDGLDELSEATGFYERSVSFPLIGGHTYYDLRGIVPGDAISVTSIWNPTESIWLTPIGIDELLTPRWETVEGAPHRFLFRGLFWLGIYPRPGSDTGSLRVYYNGMAPHFKDEGSVLSDLPDDFVPALEDYILYDLSAKDRETEKAMGHWASYLSRRKALKDFVRQRIVTARSGRMAYR